MTRQSPRKVRLVANSVRKLSLEQALRQLSVMERKASLVVTKVIRQALANAAHNHRLTIEQVRLKNILVNEGTTYKRWRAVSRGRAHTIFKRTAHIRVILETKEAEKPAAKLTASAKPSAIKKPAQKTVTKKAKK